MDSGVGHLTSFRCGGSTADHCWRTARGSWISFSSSLVFLSTYSSLITGFYLAVSFCGLGAASPPSSTSAALAPHFGVSIILGVFEASSTTAEDRGFLFFCYCTCLGFSASFCYAWSCMIRGVGHGCIYDSRDRHCLFWCFGFGGCYSCSPVSLIG